LLEVRLPAGLDTGPRERASCTPITTTGATPLNFLLDADGLLAEDGRVMARRRSWKWSLPGIVLVALIAAFFNPPDQAITHGDFEVLLGLSWCSL